MTTDEERGKRIMELMAGVVNLLGAEEPQLALTVLSMAAGTVTFPDDDATAHASLYALAETALNWRTTLREKGQLADPEEFMQ